jgi:hypothetical protein
MSYKASASGELSVELPNPSLNKTDPRNDTFATPVSFFLSVSFRGLNVYDREIKIMPDGYLSENLRLTGKMRGTDA